MTDDPLNPVGIRAITPYLAVRDARAAIAFYRVAFGARQLLLIEGPDGRIAHATVGIGSAELYLADEYPEFENVVGPETLGGTSVTIDLDVDDVEATAERAVAAGATLIRPADHPESGVQAAKVRDPFGHVWLITRLVARETPG